MNRDRNQQSSENAKKLKASIIDKALATANDLPDLKNQGLQVSAKNCSVDQATNSQQIQQIGGTPITDSSTFWIVTITHEVFPRPLFVKVERYPDGSLGVTDFK